MAPHSLKSSDQFVQVYLPSKVVKNIVVKILDLPKPIFSHCKFPHFIFCSPDQCRDSITSYLKGEPGKFEANGNHAEVTPEAKTKSYFSEPQNDVGKQSAKETLKPKIHGYGHVEEPASSLAAYQKSLEETSKFVIEEPKPCVPVSMKKMSRTSPADGKPRLNLHEEEGSSGSEQKVCHLVIQYAVLY